MKLTQSWSPTLWEWLLAVIYALKETNPTFLETFVFLGVYYLTGGG